MKGHEELARELAGLGFTGTEMRDRLLKEGASQAEAASLTRRFSSSSHSLFRKGNLRKALSGVALIITVLAIVLLPSAGGRAASLGVIGSAIGGVAMFTTFRHGERPFLGMTAFVLGVFVILSFSAFDVGSGTTVVGAGASSFTCEEVGGFCAEECAVLHVPAGVCADGLSCCGEG